jgi:hypothetical protein
VHPAVNRSAEDTPTSTKGTRFISIDHLQRLLATLRPAPLARP